MTLEEGEEKTVSALDVVAERAGNPTKRRVVHRLLYVARLTEHLTDKKALGAYYQNIFKQLQSEENDILSGILLVFSKHCVHLIEASAKVCLSVVQDLNEMATKPKPLMKDAKVLVCSTDVANRLYPLWAHRVMNTANVGGEFNTNESIDNLVGETITNLLKLGNHLSSVDKSELKPALDNLAEKVPNLLPRQNELDFFLNSEDLCAVHEFINLYTAPINPVLDQERVWPVPTRLFPYD